MTDDIKKLAFNTAIASMIEFVNTATSENAITKAQLQRFMRILSPFAPHLAQEIFSKIGEDGYVSLQKWPVHDPNQLVADVIEIPVQIMGKVRGKITVPAEATAEEIEQFALAEERVKESLDGLTVRKIIVVPGKIINIVAN